MKDLLIRPTSFRFSKAAVDHCSCPLDNAVAMCLRSLRNLMSQENDSNSDQPVVAQDLPFLVEAKTRTGLFLACCNKTP